MKFILRIFFVSLITFQFLSAQGVAGTNAKYELRSLIDMPTAGMLDKGFVGASVDLLPFGVLITKIEIGVFSNFSFGISYGASNLIGTGDPKGYDLPGVNVKFRILNERLRFPAITLGFDSQGKGLYFKNLNRYEIKSPGFYLVTSKNFDLLGYLSFHGMVNYSVEGDDGDKDINLQIGAEKTLGPQVSLIAEYDLGINDNTGSAIGKGKGYLNFGLRWSVGSGFNVGLDLRNVLNNKNLEGTHPVDRAIYIEYVKGLF